MRIALLLASSIAVGLFASTASAVVTEPNGLQVPLNGGNGEEELNTFFASQNENIDWINDAHTTPNAFSPLCGFTATFVLNQAGSHFGLAWYNETGTKPTAAELHVLLAANSPVGATFNGTNIMNDPSYTGGLVGFALVGGETHYTNPAYDTLCSNAAVCSPPGHWITALMYASTKTQNAYYICFEDGATTASGWNNDGDFNDDVFFLTGITCSGGGQPCDTGKPGICAAGLTQCTANGTTCQQLNQPAAMETCNGIDDDCNGLVDDNAVCPAGQVCDMGMCVGNCMGGEFNCPPNKVCSSDGHCIDPACKNKTCPTGQVCVAGTCKGPCDGITCPYPDVCRVGACVDPCMGVTCPSSQVCDQGVCVQSCSCQPCTSPMACDTGSGQCVDPSCVGKTCGSGTHCVSGNCVDDCMGAVCPEGQACMGGQCVKAMTAASSGASSSSGVVFGSSSTGKGSGTGGTQSTGSHASGTQSGGVGGASGAGGAGAGAAHADFGSTSGCHCRAASGGGEGGGLAMAGAALALAAASRRRRR